VVIPKLVTEVRAGRWGRPHKVINLDYLQEAISGSCQIRLTELADTLGVHRNTLHLYMKSHGIECKYAELSNTELDGIITQFKSRHPKSGLRYAMGFL